MLFAERMDRVSLLILRADLETVLAEIARAGVLHLVQVDEVDEWAKVLDSGGSEHLMNEYVKRRTQLRALLRELAPHGARCAPRPEQQAEFSDLGRLDKAIADIEDKIAPIRTARARQTERRDELRRSLAYLRVLLSSGVPFVPLQRAKSLKTMLGIGPRAQFARLQALLGTVPSVVLPLTEEEGRIHVLCMSLQKDGAVLQQALADASFEELTLPRTLRRISAETESTLVQEIEGVEAKISELDGALESAKHAVIPELLEVLGQVECAITLQRMKHFSKVTDKTCLLAGWVPQNRAQELIAAVRDKMDGRAIVHSVDADAIDLVRKNQVEVPALFKRSPLWAPFEILVEGYASPSYRMVDPTMFVAVTFLLMFGVMFGDVGHGLVLLAAGAFSLVRLPRIRNVGLIVAYCGLSSMVFGFLFGSVFGFETVLPTLWIKPMEAIPVLFKTVLAFGVFMVSLGLVLNTVHAVRRGMLLEHLFDDAGPLVAIAYWMGVGLAVKYLVSSGRLAHAQWFALVFAAPFVLLFLKGPILWLLGKSPHAFHEGVASYVMEGLVEIMEILMGYLANTVSFIRVAAFGLAHAGLFVAVFGLVRMIPASPGGRALSWMVVIGGNMFIILLEGLVVTIQVLRLEYYEFFSKFFRGAGFKYEPVAFSTAQLDEAN